jgi:hypothetical protein
VTEPVSAGAAAPKTAVIVSSSSAHRGALPPLSSREVVEKAGQNIGKG